MKRKGRKSAAQTPAPPKEQIYGSKKNPKGSAASKSAASKIELSTKALEALKNKRAKFKEKYPSKDVSLNTLKAVMRRGMGAYSTSFRPTITGGKPNSRQAWGFARVNKFLEKKAGKPVKKAYVQDDDLLAKGGELAIQIAKDVFLSRDKNALPKDAVIIAHRYNDKLKAGKEGLFAAEEDEIDIAFGKNIVYISIGKNAKVKKIRSTYGYLGEIGELQKPNPYLKDKYGYDTYKELDEYRELLDNPNYAYYEIQKKALEEMRKRGEDFEVLEMTYEDDANPHQWLITTLNNPDIRYEDGGLVAPNGKKSNLTPEQYKLVRTPEFKAWFGDWENDPENASKVVDENGEPLVVYHFSDIDFNIFELKGTSIGFFFVEDKYDDEFSAEGVIKSLDKGIIPRWLQKYSVSEKEIREGLKESKYKVSKPYFLSIKKLNKSVVPDVYWSTPAFENPRILKSKYDNYDGIEFINEVDEKRIIVAFEPYQIKLADGTNTTFDLNNPDIRYEDGGELIDNLNDYLKDNVYKDPKKSLRWRVKGSNYTFSSKKEAEMVAERRYQRELYARQNATNNSQVADGGHVMDVDGGLIAPNGKKSNLTPQQYRLVRTPEFKAWFGDWENDPENASKVVDENGEPKVMYHGTLFDFNEFIPKDDTGFLTDRNIYFFTDDVNVAKGFASIKKRGENKDKKVRIINAFINSRKPFDPKANKKEFDILYKITKYKNLADWMPDNWELLEDKKNVKKIKQLGYDSIITTETDSSVVFGKLSSSYKGKSLKNLGVFKSSQVKLADGTNTTFDPNNPDIRFAYGGRVLSSKLMMPKVRGGWTKEKILKYLKSHSSDTISTFTLTKYISEFDNWEQLKDHIYYHGTTNYIEKGLKPSITFSERFAERQGGGGYGMRYWGISLTKRKRTAENFSGMERYVSIYPVILKRDAKVIERTDISDSSEIEDIIVDLYDKGVDAVWIGGGEEELVVINPSCILLYKKGSESHQVYGGLKTKQLTDDEIKTIYQQAKENWDKYSEEYNAAKTKEEKEEFLKKIPAIKFEDGGFLKSIYEGMGNLIKNGIVLTDKSKSVSVIAYNTGNQERDKSLYNKALIYYSVKPLRQANEIIENFDNEEYSLFDVKKIEEYKNAPHLIILNQNEVVYDSNNPDIRYKEGGNTKQMFIHWTDREGLKNILSENILFEETSLTDSLKLPFDIDNNLPFGIVFKDNIYKGLYKIDEEQAGTLLEIEHEYRTKKKIIFDTYFDGFVVRNQKNRKNLLNYLENSQDFWQNDNLRKYYKEKGYNIRKAESPNKYHLGGDMSKHLAPNGNPSNLTHEQWHLVRTPQFKAWFGDWENDPQNASKVVDENGEPLVVYHGTRLDFTIFDKEKVSRNNKWGVGFYFTDDYEYAKSYANSRFNPIKDREPLNVFLNIRDEYNIHKSSTHTEYVVNESENIKLADGTNTTFDPNNPDIRYEDGGATDFGKIISASSRFKPLETIVFDPPLIGLNGAKLTSYTWSYTYDLGYNKKEGELYDKRVSDWTQAEISADTGRGIVHKYTIEMPNGEVKAVSSDSVPILLGYTDRKKSKTFPNLATASKTLAKQKLQLAILEAKLKEREDAEKSIIAEGFPPIKIEEHSTFRYRLSMDGAGCYADDPTDKERIECVKHNYIKKRLTDMGIDVYAYYNIYDVKNRIARQERKIQEILKSQNTFEDGGEISQFTSYQDALSYVDMRAKDFKNKNEFLQSEEYKKIYPKIVELYKTEKSDYSKLAKKAMNEADVKFGDRVMYDFVSPFSVENYSGIITDRDGVPYVKLDEGQKTISGQKSVKWHKGWRKETQNSYEHGGEVKEEIALPDTFSTYDKLKPILENQGYELNKIKMEDNSILDSNTQVNSDYFNKVRAEMGISVLKPEVPIEQIAKEQGVSIAKVKEELKQGIKVEKEHTNVEDAARAVASQHLQERIDYYDKLDKLEKSPIKKNSGGYIVSEKGGKEITHNNADMGGILVGRRHSKGGIKGKNKGTNQQIEVEGGEIVVSSKAVGASDSNTLNGKEMSNREILSFLNTEGGGVAFKVGGQTDKPIEYEGGEVILTRGVLQNPKKYEFNGKTMTSKEIASAINEKHTGVSFDEGGDIPEVEIEMSYNNVSDSESLIDYLFDAYDLKTLPVYLRTLILHSKLVGMEIPHITKHGGTIHNNQVYGVYDYIEMYDGRVVDYFVSDFIGASNGFHHFGEYQKLPLLSEDEVKELLEAHLMKDIKLIEYYCIKYGR